MAILSTDLASTEFQLPVALCAAAILLIWVFYPRRSSSVYPPGPRRWPIVGNLLQMPSEDASTVFTEWGHRYGELTGLRVLGRNIIIVNSREAVIEILQRRGHNYSDRPPMPVFDEWAKTDWAIFGHSYGEKVMDGRKMIRQAFNPGTFSTYEDHIEMEALRLARSLVERPDDFAAFINRTTSGTFKRVMYGFQASDNDIWIQHADNVNGAFRTFVEPVATHPVDVVPILAKLPFRLFGRGIAKIARLGQEAGAFLQKVPYDEVTKAIESNTAAPSMTKYLVEKNRLSDGSLAPAKETAIRSVLAEAFTAGSDASGVLNTLLLAMMLYPDVQRKAQAYLDAAVQEERLPRFSDRESLPYIEAIMKEALRWKPVVPLALPHLARQDDQYKGFFIPAGTTMIPNSYGILKDEKEFPQPELFKPERFSDGEKLFTDVVEPRDFAFGYGRRVCPGRMLTESLLWMNIALLLYVFDISIPVDRDGKEIMPNSSFRDKAAFSQPQQFQCTIKPRSQHHIDMLKARYDSLFHEN